MAVKERSVTRGWSRTNSSYLALVMEFPIRPITTDDELGQATQMLDKLSKRSALDKQEQGYFDSLANEIRNYEKATISIPKVSGVEMLKHLLEAKDVTLSEVAQKTDIAVSTLSAILSKKRPLNLTHIKALAPYFGVRPAVFI
jgi:HTH-type transcriptional regulator / antitoxin HigA